MAGLPPGLAAILALLGFTAVVAQIVLMRELIVVFSGNEISIGLLLASWLLWTAIGSSLLGRLATRFGDARRLMAGLQLLVAVALPLTVYVVRVSKSFLQTAPGELLGPGPMFFTGLVTLSAFCLVSGCMFAAGSRLCKEELGVSMARATGAVYLLEAAGAGIGGLLASLLLIEHLGSFQISLVLGLLNLLAASILTFNQRRLRRVIVASLVAAFALLVFPLGAPWLDRTSRSRLWEGFHLLESRDSKYGNLVVVETEGARSLYENGLVISTAPDPAAAEEAVHFALLQHPAPKRLLLVGGGINGGLRQALQHPSLEQVDYVELDPVILDLAGEYFAQEWTVARADQRVSVHNTDARLFLKTGRADYDVIIINLPDPQTAQLNRFYTLEFYREAARRLAEGGILSFQVTSSENYISPERADFLRCLTRTLRSVFPGVAAIPGATVHFFASTRPGTLTTTPDVLIDRLRSRNLKTLYLREYFLPFRMSPDRMLDLKAQIEPSSETPVNRDFTPVAYYFDVALWSSKFHTTYGSWFQALAGIDFRTLLAGVTAALCGLFAVLLLLLRRRSHRDVSSPSPSQFRLAAGACVLAMGFTLIGLEILMLLGFQAIYGYVYRQLALVVAAFMAGMALGAWRGSSRRARTSTVKPEAISTHPELPAMWAVTMLQFSAALAPILLYALLVAFARVESARVLFLVSAVAFPAIALVAGLMGGYQFPLASRVYFAGESGRNPGVLYGLDLLGACAGAVVLSAYLFPVYGFLRSAILMAMVNLAPAILAALPLTERAAPRA